MAAQPTTAEKHCELAYLILNKSFFNKSFFLRSDVACLSRGSGATLPLRGLAQRPEFLS
jgi:hypothetical protein